MRVNNGRFADFRAVVSPGKLVALAALIGSLAAVPAAAQQTLFNVPSADVLEAGKVYLEEDNLWRSGRPEDTFFTLRGVIGLGEEVEAGVNLGGFVAQGRSIPTATAAVKWQPFHSTIWSLTLSLIHI